MSQGRDFARSFSGLSPFFHPGSCTAAPRRPQSAMHSSAGFRGRAKRTRSSRRSTPNAQDTGFIFHRDNDEKMYATTPENNAFSLLTSEKDKPPFSFTSVRCWKKSFATKQIVRGEWQEEIFFWNNTHSHSSLELYSLKILEMLRSIRV